MHSMDEEIQYLGTKFAPPEITICDPCPRPRVIGITFHVQKCADKPPYDLTFLKSNTTYVNIGRKSTAEDRAMRKETDDHNAVFPCQVVSGKHAKLVFSDSQVYIIDLDSRHGTHLLKRGETVSKTIQPHVTVALADGDVLSFGKTVGGGSCLVSPVSLRVEILRDIRGESHVKHPLRSPPKVVEVLPDSPDLLRRSSSGRYGVFDDHNRYCSSLYSEASSSSSDNSGSSSEPDSEAEELSTGMPVNNVNQSGPNNGFHISVPGIRAVFDDVFRLHPHAFGHLFSPPHLSLPTQEPPTPMPIPVLDVRDDVSETHSAMELSTPSPVPSGYIDNELDIGSWFPSKPSSIASMSTPPSPVSVSKILLFPNPSNHTSPVVSPHMSEVELPKSHTSDLHDRRSEPAEVSNVVPVESVDEHAILEVKIAVREIRDDLSDIRHTLVDMDTNSRSTATHLRTIDERMQDGDSATAYKLTTVEDRLSALSQLHGQVDVLQHKCDALYNSEHTIGEVKSGIDALNALVAEMRVLRDESEKDASLKLHTLQTAHSEALSAIACEVKTFANLKRKHAEIDVVDSDDVDIPMQEPQVVPQQPIPPIGIPDAVMEPSPSKRVRTGVSITQTATAFAFGAVATWSVLAFT